MSIHASRRSSTLEIATLILMLAVPVRAQQCQKWPNGFAGAMDERGGSGFIDASTTIYRRCTMHVGQEAVHETPGTSRAIATTRRKRETSAHLDG